jgi:Tfp pilus assembly protein PilV
MPLFQQNGRGIALMEALIAVIVVAVGVVGALHVTATVLHAVQIAQERIQAVSRLEDELALLRIQARLKTGLSPGNWQGAWSQPRGSRWHATAVPDGVDWTVVSLDAQWSRAGRPYLVALSTRLPAPETVE